MPICLYMGNAQIEAAYFSVWGPHATFLGGLKGSNRPPPYVKYNVHPMFNLFRIAGTAYGHYEPKMAVLGGSGASV